MSIRKHILKLERIEDILDSLKHLDYLTTSQIRVIHNLKSKKNTSRILNDEALKQYVSFFREGENIYYLNAEGRNHTESKVVRKKTANVTHFIMRNQVYINYKCPSDWRNEIEFKVEGSFKIIADSVFTQNGRTHIVEVDNAQKMHKNEEKMKKYQVLSQLIYKRDKLPPMFVWVTTTEKKRKKLEELCKKYGLARDIHLYSELTQLNN